MDRRSRLLLIACVVPFLIAVSACGAHVGEDTSGSEPTTTDVSMATTVTVPITGTATTTIPITCGPLTAADVAAVLDVDITAVEPIADPTNPDGPPCSFRVDEWSISAITAGVPQLPPRSHTEGAERLPPVPEVELPSGLDVSLQRGGHYAGRADIIDDDRMVTVLVDNDGEGPDTWASVPGAAQAPRTNRVTTAIAQRVASRL